MKPQLLKFVKVCLLTLLVLSPALGVMSAVWLQHLNFVAAQHLVYVVTNNQQLTTYADSSTVDVLIWLMFFAPIGFCLGIALYDRYMVYRAAVRQRQIEMLERIWQHHIYVKEITL
ncbi:MAG: hypothetical protein KAF91_25370 [Nostoc sp. TH1S01]|nr:hypothetical protein [Nostoc sp. TH1S01]